MPSYKINTKTLWFAILQTIVFYAKTQNLVSNGYFEVVDSCPPAIISPNDTYLSDATGWQVSSLTPDLYNACSTGNNNVPYAALGYQKDCCGGNGYAGEYVFYKNSLGNDQREYIYTKLTNTLVTGHKYLASMYVCNSNYWHNAIVTMGMLFTDTATVLPSGQGYIPTNPQVKSTILLTDTLNWMLVQDTLTAVGNEVYLTIGNFSTDAACGIVSAGSEAYYYIDGVSVYDLATLGIEQLAANKKQSINLYPNPNNGNMMVDYTITNDATMEIVDVTGNIIGQYTLSALNKNIEIHNNNLANGVYLYRITNANGILQTGRVVIMK
jgi:type IX secretion system substrate protein